MAKPQFTAQDPIAREADLFIGAIWRSIQTEAQNLIRSEPALTSLVGHQVCVHKRFESALVASATESLSDSFLPASSLSSLIENILLPDRDIVKAAARDLSAIVERDPAASGYLRPFLFYPGFRALLSHRIANRLWRKGQHDTALVIQSIVSRRFAIDIHPAARLGHGIFIDHGIGVVIGETAILEDDISMLHEVTIGGSGRQSIQRHPHIRQGVLLGAGATIIGDVEIGESAKVGAGSLVSRSVPARSIAVGVPATVVGRTDDTVPALSMNHTLS